MDDQQPTSSGARGLATMGPCIDAPDIDAGSVQFLGLLRWLSARRPDLPVIGEARSPRVEALRIGQHASLCFAPREIARCEDMSGRLAVQLFGLGMLGPNGPLPLHITETVRERTETFRDRATADFLDLFHHRALSQFYLAWARAQPTVGLDRPRQEAFTRYIACLAGLDESTLVRRALPSHARISAAPHLVRIPRSADALASTLSHYFRVPVAIDEFLRDWIPIDPSERCRLNSASDASRLGAGASLGYATPDAQHRIRVVMGPMPLPAYLGFCRSGRRLRELAEWIHEFTHLIFAWTVELRLDIDAAPPMVLGAPLPLGWLTWLAKHRDGKFATGATFSPELCRGLEP